MTVSNGHSVTRGGVTIWDGKTYSLPDGQLVRGFIERVDQPVPVVVFFTPEDWALSNLAAFQVDGTDRLEGMPRGAEPPVPTGWTLADLRPAEASAWDDAVTQLGGQPWLQVDNLVTGASPDEQRQHERH